MAQTILGVTRYSWGDQIDRFVQTILGVTRNTLVPENPNDAAYSGEKILCPETCHLSFPLTDARD